jgi:hypothetical protein
MGLSPAGGPENFAGHPANVSKIKSVGLCFPGVETFPWFGFLVGVAAALNGIGFALLRNLHQPLSRTVKAPGKVGHDGSFGFPLGLRPLARALVERQPKCRFGFVTGAPSGTATDKDPRYPGREQRGRRWGGEELILLDSLLRLLGKLETQGKIKI